MDPSTVLLEHVSRTYRSDGAAHTAIRDLTMRVEKGEFLAVMGPSGCGKSTLLNMISGIDRPDGGTVLVAGARLDRLSETGLALFRRRHIGIVFQFYNLISNLNVRTNIELPALLAGVPQRQARARLAELVSLLGIAELVDRMPGQLSGGQRQRVALARALINSPTLLLADEPTGALDQESGQAVLALLRHLHRQGQTIIMVTHDPRVSGIAQRILVMEDGRITEELSAGLGHGRPRKAAERLLGTGGAAE